MKAFSLNYSKSRQIDLGKWETKCETEDKFNPYEITQLQCYNPIYSLFFELNDKNYNKISLNQKRHIVDIKSVWNDETKEMEANTSFIKFSPLLDPIHTLIGKYGEVKIQNLEEIYHGSVSKTKCIQKLLEPFNASYVDCFFNYLSSQIKNTHAFENGIEFYGSYIGIQKHYKMNITDDFDYLQDSEFFMENMNKTFIIDQNDITPTPNMNSHKNKPKISISNESVSVTCTELECDEIVTGDIDDISLVYEKESTHNSTVSSSDNSIESASDDEWSEMSNDKVEPEEEHFAYIKDFPVQMICIEQCDGTFDELLEKEMLQENEISSALMQVVMTLITYQKAFQFTHNDLHTNNIVYKNTDQECIEYIYKKKNYKVPTYGKIYKIIDFGRSIYRFQDKVICSDSFAPNGDANTQYNTEPFLNDKKPRLEPNMSFDLCRLGCSMYDFVMNDSEPETELQKMIMAWCTDDAGKNILYKKNGEERYPNFKLYKMIARIVHKNVPETQLELPYFSRYITDEEYTKVLKVNIDLIPKYFKNQDCP